MKKKEEKKTEEKNKLKESKNKQKQVNKDNRKAECFNKYLIYIFIFSLLGLLIEAIWCFLISEEKGFVLGPLCPIYGICIVILIKCLENYKDNKVKVFIYGMILGTIMEYIVSFMLEAVSGLKFWDCSGTILNFSERINTIHIPLFGVISVIIMISKPLLDILISKIKGKIRIILDIILSLILIIDIIFTIWGITVYNIRTKEQLDGKNYISNNTFIEKFQNEVFSNENMSTIFPRLK